MGFEYISSGFGLHLTVVLILVETSFDLFNKDLVVTKSCRFFNLNFAKSEISQNFSMKTLNFHYNYI